MTPRRRLPIIVALALVVGACGSTGDPSGSTAPSGSVVACATTPEPAQASLGAWSATSQSPTVFPQIITPVMTCGQNRLLFSFLDSANVPVAAPDRTASVALYDLGADPETPVTGADGTFVWAIEDSVGIYVADVDIPTAGLWGAEFTTAAAGAEPETIRMQFEVRPDASVISVGDAAPPSVTPTLADVDGDVTKISTDDEPVERFYEASVAGAVEAGEPFVLIFATPRFCASAQCGPTLDKIKPIAAANPDVTFINVEPYELKEVDGQLQPVLDDAGQLTPAQSTRDWQLLSEPWVFVVDGDGIVRSSLALIFSDEELESAISAVEGT